MWAGLQCGGKTRTMASALNKRLLGVHEVPQGHHIAVSFLLREALAKFSLDRYSIRRPCAHRGLEPEAAEFDAQDECL